MKFFIYLCGLLQLTFGQQGILNKFEVCKRSDPKLDLCLKNAIQKSLSYVEYGVKEYDVPSLQPIEVSAWSVKGTKNIPFEQKYTNVRVYNALTGSIEDVRSSITDNDFSIYIRSQIPLIKFVGQYVYENAIFLGQNVTGAGTLLYVITNVTLELNVTGLVKRTSDKSTLEIQSSFVKTGTEHLDINLGHYHLDLSRENNEHLNKNWVLIFDELNAGYSEIYAFGFKKTANAIFSQVNYDMIFPK